MTNKKLLIRQNWKALKAHWDRKKEKIALPII